jgi:3-deoxy-D-manno-octulosonate 8-phosphate phosphatase (KDO 8-P phosphatase)
MSADFKTRLATIKLFALDVDGVLTDGRLWYFEHGGEAKAFHAHDGHGLKRLMRAGVEVALITARRSPMAARRAHELGVARYYESVIDKGACLRDVAGELGIELDACAYMGDDEPDLPALAIAGLTFAPANATEIVRHRVDWRATARGGDGAVREACELLLAARGSA